MRSQLLRKLSHLMLGALLFVLLGAADCPLRFGNSEGGGGGGTTAAVDVGGQEGAVWQVTAEPVLLVTLRTADGQLASAQVEVGRGFVTLLGQTIEIDDFCWRSEVACPQHVLATNTVLQQPSDNSGVLLSFNARGPLSQVGGNALAGRLDGRDLSVPLAVGNATTGNCGLLETSSIGATAFAETALGSQATALTGRIAVTYTGTCLALGGNAALGPEDVVQISGGFTATRNQ